MAKTRPSRTTAGASRTDAAQDRRLVQRGVHQHEAALHRGKPKTKLKLGGGWKR